MTMLAHALSPNARRRRFAGGAAPTPTPADDIQMDVELGFLVFEITIDADEPE